MTHITDLEPLPPSLEYMSIVNSKITSLQPELPSSLKSLCLSNINLSTLPPFPPPIKSITLGGLNITEIPPLPEKLCEFRCENIENITELPIFTQKIYEMYVRNCPKIKSIPEYSFENLTYCSPLPLSQHALLPSTFGWGVMRTSDWKNYVPINEILTHNKKVKAVLANALYQTLTKVVQKEIPKNCNMVKDVYSQIIKFL